MNDTMAGAPGEMADRIRAAQVLLKRNRAQGLAALNDLFRTGHPPEPLLDGPHEGELVAVDIAPGITQAVEFLTSLWMPWKGKYFLRADFRGDNIFAKKWRLLLRLLFPLYKGIIENDAETVRAFVFKTSIAPGKVDPDRQVLKIDYDLPENPALTIRRILDEVVQVNHRVYLGKIHFKWWWGKWQMIGYFSLRAKAPS